MSNIAIAQRRKGGPNARSPQHHSSSSHNSSGGKNDSLARTGGTGAVTAAVAVKPEKLSRGNNHDRAGRNQHCGPQLEAASILNNPRLRQVTGLPTHKLARWNGMRPPRDELLRLRWALSFPDVYPVKRPKGNF
ncbi:uncharacterized protein F4822DRAFT_250359 [Hypoxylon trugodes]|uniref:uncharacterized protein n=1 Tax=Hypoxylon trugodes TaxID=326681 RepID=UPI0021A0125C|nr:uncharacterized protein F4822DRAFT_250359 [Hypoxylon trugodes]KAI1388570.1 hypothetical protein F4822DRAFT_250359 [Hypoxylon trugodes]